MPASDLRLNLVLSADGKQLNAVLTDSTGKVREFGAAGKESGAQAAHGFQEAGAGLGVMGEKLREAKDLLLEFFGVVAGVEIVKKIVEQADAYEELSARIKLAAGEGGNWESRMEDIIAIAQRSHQPLQIVGELYERITRATQDLGIADTEVAALTETVAKAVQLSGGSAEQAQMSISRFAAALASGEIKGQGFSLMLRQMPELARAIANGLGVSIEKLHQMGNAGELSAQQVTAALLKQKDTIDKQYSQLPVSIGKAINDLATNWQVYIGKANESLGATHLVASSIEGLSGHLGDLDAILGVLAVGGLAKLVSMVVSFTREALSADAASGVLGASLTKLLSPMGMISAGFAVLMAYDVGGWLRNLAVSYEQNAAAGNKFAAVLRAIGLAATEDEAATANIARNQELLTAKLKQVSDQTGVTVTSVKELDAMLKAGVITFDQASGAYQKGAISLETFRQSASATEAVYKNLTAALDFGSKLLEKNAQNVQAATAEHAKYLHALGDEKGALDANVEAAKATLALDETRADNVRAELAQTEQVIQQKQVEIQGRKGNTDVLRDELAGLEKTAAEQRTALTAAEQAVTAEQHEIELRKLAVATYGDQSDKLYQLAGAQAQARGEVEKLAAAERAAAAVQTESARLAQAIAQATDELRQAIARGDKDLTGYITRAGELKMQQAALLPVIQAGEDAHKKMSAALEREALATARLRDAAKDAAQNAQDAARDTERQAQLLKQENDVQLQHLELERKEAEQAGNNQRVAQLDIEIAQQRIAIAQEAAAAKAREVQAAQAVADTISALAKAQGGELLPAEKEAIQAALDHVKSLQLELQLLIQIEQHLQHQAEAEHTAASESEQRTQRINEEMDASTKNAGEAALALADIVSTTRASLHGLSENLGAEFERMYTAMFPPGRLQTLAMWIDTWNGLTNQLMASFNEQKASAASLTEQLKAMDVPIKSIIDGAKGAAGSMRLLGDQQLGPLRQAIADAQQKLQALEDQAKSALQSTQDELDQLLGNQRAIEDRAYAAREEQLKAQLDAARTAQDQAAQDELAQALANAEKIHRIKLANIKDEAARQSQADQQHTQALQNLAAIPPGTGGMPGTAPGTAAPTVTKVVRVQFPLQNGAAPALDATEASAEAFFQQLQRAGMRALSPASSSMGSG